MSESTVPANQTVTISVELQVPRGREAEYQSFVDGISHAAERFPGFVDVRTLRPARGSRNRRVVLRFENDDCRQAWLDSEDYRVWSGRAEDLSDSAPRVANISGTAQEQPLSLVLTPLDEFVRTSVSGIGLLLVGTAVALVMANTHFADSYDRLWNTKLAIGTDDFRIVESLRHWVNDGLMALFFFIVGLEIKREVLVGELRQIRQAALPISAAVGGAVAPALVYLLINIGGAQHGWGIPIGTDTAFSIGVLSLLGARVSPLLLVFLTAFAIVDDIMAVGVIAIFYTDHIDWGAVGIAAVLLALLILANRAGFQRWPIYAALGIGVWIAIFASGIHGTLAGVLVAMTVPSRSWINPREFLRRGRDLLDDFERLDGQQGNMLSNQAQQHASQRIQRLAEDVETPMTHLEHRLNPWVSYLVLPVFAFANAGIPLRSGLSDAAGSAVMWGVAAGLVIGKPLGITLFAWLAVRSGIALLPESINFRQIFGVAGLGGIGFTMSLFITELAFPTGVNANHARIGVLFGSIVAGTIGFLLLRQVLPSETAPEDEAKVL